MNIALSKIQNQIDTYKEQTENSVGELSDGYHSFNNLYKHRTYLLALAMAYIPYSWKSRSHEDGSMYDDMFVAGFPTPTGMVTYHCDNEYWEDFKVPEIPHAPHFDGYTDTDVLNREKGFLDSGAVRLVNKNNIQAIQYIVINQILPVFNSPVEQAGFMSFWTH